MINEMYLKGLPAYIEINTGSVLNGSFDKEAILQELKKSCNRVGL